MPSVEPSAKPIKTLQELTCVDVGRMLSSSSIRMQFWQEARDSTSRSLNRPGRQGGAGWEGQGKVVGRRSRRGGWHSHRQQLAFVEAATGGQKLTDVMGCGEAAGGGWLK